MMSYEDWKERYWLAKPPAGRYGYPYVIWDIPGVRESLIDDYRERGWDVTGPHASEEKKPAGPKIRYIVMADQQYEGLWPAGVDGSDEEPLPSYATREEAIEAAKELGLMSPKGRRDESEILAVSV